ncbi:MAG TPA: MFS transporter [Stellaceae bacterium]|nr:MFS transporter [Stellaceae bacterium]
MKDSKTIVVAALGSTQTLAWASSYYLPAILGAPIAKTLGLAPSLFFGIFSVALLLSSGLAPIVGRVIDRHGGRPVLALSNVVLAMGLAMLGLAQGVGGLIAAWLVLGVGTAMGLYSPAFATLTRLYGVGARAPITGITLFAGFASTIGWPLSAFMLAHYGWREACFLWAALNLFLCAPANWLLIPTAPAEPPIPRVAATGHAPSSPEPQRGAMLTLAFFFAATRFVSGALAAHLPRLLEGAGASAVAAIAAGALVGPAQVGARLFEFGILRSFHPLIPARVAALLHPVGAACMAVLGPAGITFFAILHGAGNGMLTIAGGTLPLALFGPTGYGKRTGLLAVPTRIAESAAPLLFGLLIDQIGTAAIAVSAGLCLAAFASLFALRARAAPGAALPAAR